MNIDRQRQLRIAIGKSWWSDDEELADDEDYLTCFSDNGGWSEFAGEVSDGGTAELDGFAVKVIEEYGNDDGNAVFIIFEIDGKLYKVDGQYYSHMGTEWEDDLYEVEAVVKPVTFYEGV